MRIDTIFLQRLQHEISKAILTNLPHRPGRDAEFCQSDCCVIRIAAGVHFEFIKQLQLALFRKSIDRPTNNIHNENPKT